MVEAKKKRGNRRGKGGTKKAETERVESQEGGRSAADQKPEVGVPVVVVEAAKKSLDQKEEVGPLRDMVTPMKKEESVKMDYKDMEAMIRQLKEDHEASLRGLNQHMERVEAARDRLRGQRDEALNEADELKQQLEDSVEKTRIEYEEKLHAQKIEASAAAELIENLAASLAAAQAKTEMSQRESDAEKKKFFAQVAAAESKADEASKERAVLTRQIAEAQANYNESIAFAAAERETLAIQLAQVKAAQTEAETEREAMKEVAKAKAAATYSAEELEAIKSTARSELYTQVTERGLDAFESEVARSAVLERLHNEFEKRLQTEKNAFLSTAQEETRLAVEAAKKATEAEVRDQLLKKLKKKVHDAKEEHAAELRTAMTERDEARQELDDLKSHKSESYNIFKTQLSEARTQIADLETRLKSDHDSAAATLAVVTAQTTERVETEVRDALLAKLKKKVHDTKQEHSQEINILTARTQALESEQRASVAQLESQAIEVNELKAQLSASQAQLATLHTLTQDASSAQDAAYTAALEETRAQLSMSTSQIKTLEDNAIARQDEADTLRKQVSETEARIKMAEDAQLLQLTDLRSKLSEKDAQIKAIEEAQGKTENTIIEDLRAQLATSASRITGLEAEAQTAAKEHERLVTALEEAQTASQKSAADYKENITKKETEHADALATFRAQAEDEREAALDDLVTENLKSTAAAVRKRELELGNLHAVALEELEEALSTESQQIFAEAETKHKGELSAVQQRLDDTSTKLASTERRCTELASQIEYMEKQGQEQRRQFERDLATQIETLQLRHRAEVEQAILQAKWQVGGSSKNRDQDEGYSAQLREELNTLQASAAIEKRSLETQINELHYKLEQNREQNHALAARLGVLTCDTEIIRQSATSCFTRVSNRVVTNVENLYEVVQPRLADITAQMLASANNLHTNGGSNSTGSP